MVTEKDRRRYARPLRELTEHELDALDQLGPIIPLLREYLQNPLAELIDLALYEATMRDSD